MSVTTLNPDQALRIFFCRFSPLMVKDRLQLIFNKLAADPDLARTGVLSPQNVALLFDQLNQLIAAAHALQYNSGAPYSRAADLNVAEQPQPPDWPLLISPPE